jgi:hypothetical protein
MIRPVTGIFMILLPIAFNATFFSLARAFEYPDILRKPTDHILKRFSEGGTRLRMLWYLFALTALLAIPVALLLQRVFPDQPELAAASALLGVISGVVQAMGLLRWSLLVTSLAQQYNAPGASQATKDAVGVVFNAFHQYIGVVVGEHLGYLFTGAWTILLAVMMFNSPTFGAILGTVGIVAALGILAGMAEPFGWKPAGAVNAMSYILWSLWLIVSGIALLLV